LVAQPEAIHLGGDVRQFPSPSYLLSPFLLHRPKVTLHPTHPDGKRVSEPLQDNAIVFANRPGKCNLAQAGAPEMAVDCSVLRRSVRTRDLRVPITSADAALARKVGHHLEITQCEASGDAFTVRIQLIRCHPVLSTGIDGQCIGLALGDKRCDPPGSSPKIISPRAQSENENRPAVGTTCPTVGARPCSVLLRLKLAPLTGKHQPARD
jgi:hypothetical protein